MPMIRTSIQDKETNVGPDLGESEVVQRGREEKCKETERGRNKKLKNCRPVGWGCRLPLTGPLSQAIGYAKLCQALGGGVMMECTNDSQRILRRKRKYADVTLTHARHCTNNHESLLNKYENWSQHDNLSPVC
jgi:hypothetical protein